MNPRVAIVGTGYWGKNLVRNFQELGHLAMICDSNEIIKSGFEEKYPDTRYSINYSEVLDNDEVDAAVIATPAATHYQMAKEALNAGKHVFVEKPLSLNLKEGEELVSLAEKNSLVLMVGHILQYHNAVIKLKELIDEGVLGKIQYIYSNRLSIGKIRAEENILWSFAPHDISVILMLLNETPESVFATGGNYLQEGIPDVTMTTMNFPSGVNAHIFVSWLHPYKEQKLVVVGNEKMAVFDDVSENKLQLYPHEIKWVDRIPVASKAEAEIVPIEVVEPLKAECQHFLDCIQGNRRPRTDGNEGLRVLRILNASQLSLDQKGIAITLTDSGEQSAGPSLPTQPEPKFFVHRSAYVDEGVEIGENTRIWHFSHVLKSSRIGRDCRIGQNVVIGPNVSIGNGCKIQNNISIYEGVTLEDFVFCGPSMVFTNVFNPRSEIPRMDELRITLVKKGATIGANATIICGNTIGSYAFIGSGAVVTKDVPDYALILGNPGKVMGWMCKCGIKLTLENNQAGCQACGLNFEFVDGQLRRKT
ncbi:Gfo/Idh/MocA family oxidoreductase [Thermodesulfobacteriota bacterium]